MRAMFLGPLVMRSRHVLEQSSDRYIYRRNRPPLLRVMKEAAGRQQEEVPEYTPEATCR